MSSIRVVLRISSAEDVREKPQNAGSFVFCQHVDDEQTVMRMKQRVEVLNEC